MYFHPSSLTDKIVCRPLNTKEIDENSPSIIECSPPIGKLTVQGLKYESKTFSYDHVFGPEATQLDVYRTLVEPLLDEVLTGFNCTVFAYGQTGTSYHSTGSPLTFTAETNDAHSCTYLFTHS
eukprot:m.162635 g.162635  ORF g.162635 m.162635 type:complete len:123 (+) comp16388_c0_seq44:450-818(+)